MNLTLDQALQKGVEAHKAGKVQEADLYYTAILKAQPKHPDANHNMGVLAVGVGKVEEALPFFKIALESNHNIAQYWLSYINALIKLDRLTDAKAVFDQAKTIGVKGEALHELDKQMKSMEAVGSQNHAPPQDQLQPIINLCNQNQYKKALEAILNLLKRFPSSATLFNIQGAANSGLHQFDAAIVAYNRALTLKPDFADAYYNLGVALKALGKLEEAKEAYNKAISIKTDYAEAYHNLGVIYQDQGDLEKAILAYEKAISIEPNDEESYNNIGVALHKQGNFEEAVSAYMIALKIKPDYFEVYNNLGVSLKEQGRLEEALAAHKKALTLKPDDAETYTKIGNVLKEWRKLEQAIEAYNQALSIEPNYPDAYSNMGVTLQKQGKLQGAIQAFQKALSIKPQDAEVYLNLGNALQEQEKVEDAIEAFKKALSIKPDYAEAYNNMGSVLEEKGILEDAIEAFNKALSIKPNLAEAWSNGADALDRWNKLDQLEIWLNRALDSFNEVPTDILFQKAKMLWRKKKHQETFYLLEDIKIETISEIRRQDYLHLKAKCFEKFEKFEDAYKCYAKSNTLAKKSKEYSICDHEQYFQNVKDKLAKLKSRSGKNKKSQPTSNPVFSPAFLVGFPRSGTTLLDTILRSNSKISVVEEQQMLSVTDSFLSQNGYSDFSEQLITPRLKLEAQKIYTKELSKHIDTTLADKVFVDKLPLNLLKAPLIHQLYPNAKFILALRHPMDTILSCWMQNFKLNRAMAIMVDMDRIVDFYCIAMETFKICRTYYNLDVHEIRYEDLINNFQKESEAVVQFLNLNWEPEMENYQDTAIKRGRIYTPSYSQVVQPIYKEAQYRWLNYKKYLEQYLDQVEPWILEFGYD
jgi:tetratricopeptide (TPR) repeat protein